MYYLIGDIHGFIDKLAALIRNIEKYLDDGDTIIFLGDYIDRGLYSYEVIEYLIDYSEKHNIIFLRGNHEDLLKKYLCGQDQSGSYLYNGGSATIRSYIRNCGSFRIPRKHEIFYDNLKFYHENEDFIAVHAGLNPNIDNIADQDIKDLLWIRDEFYMADKRWEKTVIFGHSPILTMSGKDMVYFDDKKNIIAIDSGVIFGRGMSCLRWPDKKIFSSET